MRKPRVPHRPTIDPGGGRVDGALGTRTWAERWRLETQGIVKRLSYEPDRLEGYFRIGQEHRAWTIITRKYGEPFESFAEFCAYEQPWGLGMKLDDIRPYIEALHHTRPVDVAVRSLLGMDASQPSAVGETTRSAVFEIGKEFFSRSGRWLCTDIGSRTVTVIKKDMPDDRWYAGPPYAVAEVVFDEDDMGGCVATYEEAVARWDDEFVAAERERVAPPGTRPSHHSS